MSTRPKATRHICCSQRGGPDAFAFLLCAASPQPKMSEEDKTTVAEVKEEAPAPAAAASSEAKPAEATGVTRSVLRQIEYCVLRSLPNDTTVRCCAH
jgi:hypothetical protein